MDSSITIFLLILGVILFLGVTSTRVASRIGVPALVLFVGLGMVLGSDISGWIYFDDPWVAQLIGTAALAIILFEGGLQTEWKAFRPVMVPSGVLATAGVVLTAVLTGFISWFVLRIDLPLAMLIGCIVGSTDAAAVFAVMGTQNVKQRLRITLEAESALNDPMAVFLTIFMIDWIMKGPPSFWGAIGFYAWQMGLGLATGLTFGWLMVRLVRKIRFDTSGMYPLLLFAGAFVAFAVTAYFNGSGFVTVYVLGIVLRAADFPYKQSVIRFHEGMAWMAQMVMFTALGLLVFPSQLPAVTIPGLLVAGGLMFLARPLAVGLLTIGMGFSLKELIFLAWTGLRGSVPIILATYPLVAGVPQSNLIFNIVLFVVITSMVLQGSSLKWLANKLGLTEGETHKPAISLELLSMEQVDADMMEIILPPGSKVAGRRLADLQLPQQATISALVRQDQLITPRGATKLAEGDVLYVLAKKEQSGRVMELLMAEA